MTSLNIKFPEKHYVGFSARTHESLPVGFMTPWGTDKAFDKRKTTVDNWASKTLPAQTYDNVPLSGFRLVRNVRHSYGWGSGNVKWRVEDPRGFELEISSPNFQQILSRCVLEEGEILSPCIWARLGNENVLVPVNSDIYQQTLINTQRMAKSVSLRDVSIGDEVVMKNGQKMIYMGNFHPVVCCYDDYSTGSAPTCREKKKHLFYDGKAALHFIGSPKIAEINKTANPKTSSQSFAELIQKINNAEWSVNENTNDDKFAVSVAETPFSTSDLTLTAHTFDLKKWVADNVANNTPYIRQFDGLEYREHMFFEHNGKTYELDSSTFFRARGYMPGGYYHQHTPHLANHPQYCDYIATEIKNDIIVDKKIIYATTSAKSGWFNNSYQTNNTISMNYAQYIPDSLLYYKWEYTDQMGNLIQLKF